jgi:hypothetical protein
VTRAQRITLARYHERRWQAFFASPYFASLMEQARADIDAGRTQPMPETDEEWAAFEARTT